MPSVTRDDDMPTPTPYSSKEPPSVIYIGYWTAPRIVALVAAISFTAWPWVTVLVDDMTIFDPRIFFGVCISGLTAVIAGSIASIKNTNEGGK